MKFARRKTEPPEVNLTPLIDVVFLLLIFFMVSTSFKLETQLMVELPSAEGVISSDPVDTVTVTVGRTGNYAVNERVLLNQSVEVLRNTLQAVSKGRHDRPLILMADAQAPHQA
ncbi:MAG: biopolymer transporter ExbD, partial [Pseudomonadales bacterium]|nr:biopolymer transporter ExbD [Pseudomonadales bacterium]